MPHAIGSDAEKARAPQGSEGRRAMPRQAEVDSPVMLGYYVRAREEK